MHLGSGLQRLALLLGVIGAILGGSASFKELQPILRHNKFEALKDSEIVQQEARKYTADVQQIRANYFAKQKWLDSQIPPLNEKATFEETNRRNTRITQVAMEAGSTASETYGRFERIERVHSELNRDGIKTISWTYDYGHDSIDKAFPWPRHLDVLEIETQAGEAFYPSPKPAASLYFLIVFFPVIGFFVPWSAVYGIAWVVAGFSHQSQR
jgi:hypothetical protein